jgi:hypothetical protein
LLITSAIVALLGGVLAVSTVLYRQARIKDDPVLLWHRAWTSGAEAAAFLAAACHLTREARSLKWSWLTDLLLAPIFVFWGPMTSMLPERALARWRLVGARPGGRSLRIDMPAGRANLSIACVSDAAFWVSASRDGADWPLEEQEGVRLLHPVGSRRWQDGTALIRSAFALGIDRVRAEDGRLLADVELGERGPSPDQYPGILDAFDSLAGWIETRDDPSAPRGPSQ